MMEAATHPVTRDLDVPETTFTEADLTTFLGLDALGLTTLGQLGCEFMSVLRVAQLLGVAWHTASTTILTRAEQVLSPATRTASAVWMKVLGVDDSLARFAIKREVSLLCGAT